MKQSDFMLKSYWPRQARGSVVRYEFSLAALRGLRDSLEEHGIAPSDAIHAKILLVCRKLLETSRPL